MRENNAKALVNILDPTACHIKFCMTWLEGLITFTETFKDLKCGSIEIQGPGMNTRDFQGLSRP